MELISEIDFVNKGYNFPTQKVHKLDFLHCENIKSYLANKIRRCLI